MHKLLDRWATSGWAVTTILDNVYILTRREMTVRVLLFDRLLELDTLRTIYHATDLPVFIAVHEALITEDTFVPDDFLRALHALYYGRIYSYNDAGELWGVHLARDERIPITAERYPDWKLVRPVKDWTFRDKVVNSMLHGFPGTFRVAMLHDENWWKTTHEWRAHSGGFNTNPPPQSPFGAARHPQVKTAWDVLGMTPTADDKAIKKRYRELARAWHPDLHGNSEESNKRMAEINEAYRKVMP